MGLSVCTVVSIDKLINQYCTRNIKKLSETVHGFIRFAFCVHCYFMLSIFDTLSLSPQMFIAIVEKSLVNLM